MTKFQLLDQKFEDSKASIQNITEHITELETNFLHYLGEKTNFTFWIKQPFFAEMQEDDQLADEPIDLQANSKVKRIFDAVELPDFWSSIP